ncbi:MAG: glycosyl hydrolase-related protein [Oscillospiraceae bacterium]|nr:glycosyl hydrolase-related protein [Oscillospiraceae bacterium]
MMNQKQIERMIEKLRRFERSLHGRLYNEVGRVDISMYTTFDRLSAVPADAAYIPVEEDGAKWGAERQHAWFKGSYKVPGELDGQTLFIWPDTGGFEGLLWVNGRPFGNFNNLTPDSPQRRRGAHYCKMIASNAKSGNVIDIALEVYAGHNIDGTQPFEPNTGNTFEFTAKNFRVYVKNEDIYDFYFNLKIINDLWGSLEDGFRKGQLTNALYEAHKVLFYSPDNCEYSEFVNGIKAANTVLKKELAKKSNPSAGQARITGHSHMDTAWLWEIEETIKKCARTYSNQLSLMQQYDEYKFVQSSAYHLEVIRRGYPELFEDLTKVIAQGKYEPNGGVWVECDCNITSGESMIRQFLWGQRYTREHFRYTSNTFWLPDTFGYSAAIPQIMKGCSVDYFCTTKIEWNDTNIFPYDSFYWEGIDGTKVFSHFNKISVQPVPHDFINLVANPQGWIKQKSVTDKRLLVYGQGDGGGGPTAEQAELARRCFDLDGCPRVQYQTVGEFMTELENTAVNPNTWSGELYFELHRATLTALHQMKRNNRKAEYALRDAEILTVYDAVNKNKPASGGSIREHMETLLVNQFHDILPGTSIPEVNDIAYRENTEVIGKANKISEDILSGYTNGDREYITAYNTLSFRRSDVITIKGKEGKGLDCDYCSQQLTRNIDDEQILRVSGAPLSGFDIDPFSSKAFKLINFDKVKKSDSNGSAFKYEKNRLITPFFKVVFDRDGTISSFIDTRENRQLKGNGYNLNTFIMCEDVPQSWDNWDIDADSEVKYHNVSKLVSSEVISNGEVEFRIRNKYKISEKSTLIQDMIFYAHSPRIDFETVIDWNDAHRFLKTAFDTNIRSGFARSEIQFGYIQRPTTRNESFEQAKFEALNHKYTDLSEIRYGAAILNDCKYGISVNGGSLRLSLIKSGTRPDARGDRGTHKFTYSFLPHTGGFCAENAIQPAYELNVPHRIIDGAVEIPSWLSLDKPNILIEAIKPCEDTQNAYILRLYEAEGGQTGAKLKISHPVKRLSLTNMLEEHIENIPVSDEIELNYSPFEIKTIKVEYP